mgnify:CR=1 FL=1
MIFYFSGTGNTRYVTRDLCKKLSEGFDALAFDISGTGELSAELRAADCVLLAFPVYGSSPPVPMRRFVYDHADVWKGKEVIVVATQYMFSGDGAASLGRSVRNISKCQIILPIARRLRSATEKNLKNPYGRRKRE